MNVEMTQDELNKLPYRDDIVGDYVKDQTYRSRAYPDLVFVFMGMSMGNGGAANCPVWWTFKITDDEGF